MTLQDAHRIRDLALQRPDRKASRGSAICMADHARHALSHGIREASEAIHLRFLSALADGLTVREAIAATADYASA
jgi:hypothetical protein